MYYSLKTDCYFRKYGKIGYLSRPIITTEEVVDEIGAIFLDKLSYLPIHIDDVVKQLFDELDGIDKDELKEDVLEFFSSLEIDGFLNKSLSVEKFVEAGFEYSTLEGKFASSSLKPQLEESSSHFLKEYFKNDPYLHTFHIELTSKCNERCIHCYIPHEDKIADITYDLMVDALTQCREMDVLTIVFSGGEPMLHPHFCDFLKIAKDMDFNVTVLSNLTVVTDEILEALTYRHASCVNVSLYSMDAETHDEITNVQGSHEKTVSNILKLIKNNVPIQINCPVMKQNKDSFYKVIEWGQNHKCTVNTDYLIMARADRSTDNLSNRLTNEDLEKVIGLFLENDAVVRSNIKNLNEYDLVDVSLDDRVCGVGITTLCMVTNGDVYPCAGWQKFICGNIKNNPLKKIWKDSPQVNYLRGLRQRDFKKCIDCKDKDFCLMCMSRNSNEDENGDIFNIPPITCDAAKIHHNMVIKMKNGSK